MNTIAHRTGESMHIHVIMHVPFEGPGLIEDWAEAHRFQLTRSLALTEEHPALAPGDLLVVMGGPMSADDEDASPWLRAERLAIAAALDAGASVLGVCLGAQILAGVLGGSVARNPQREIGWYPVHASEAAANDPVFSAFPRELVVGHWHGDTFTLPSGTAAMLSSDATANQAFSALNGRAVGLQFHLEWSQRALAELIARCGEEIGPGGEYVATASSMLAAAPSHIPACREALFGVLDRMVARGSEV